MAGDTDEVDKAEVCSHCEAEFNGDKVIGCEGSCKGWFHLTITNCNGVKWFCKSCYDRSDIVNMNTVRSMLDNAMKQFLEEVKSIKNIMTSANTSIINKSKSFADAVTSTNYPAVSIKPKAKEQENKTTRLAVKDKIKPSELSVGVVSVVNINNGGILVKCNNAEEVKKFEEKASKELGENMT